MITTEELIKQFESLYHEVPVAIFFAPGRVNLIGEHIDYNGGLVLPAALNLGTYLLVSHCNKELCRISSLNNGETYTFNEEAFSQDIPQWTRYPLGVMKEFADRHFNPFGFQMLYYSNIPIKASLSSSAAMEVVTATMLNNLLETHFSTIELVKMSQHAENSFVGMQCGIMDQFISGLGKKDHAIALNCNTLEYKEVSMRMKGLKLLIANSNKTRQLVNSKYNERREECETALKCLSKTYPKEYLCQYTVEELPQLLPLLQSNILKNRVQHTVEENDRVKHAIAYLENGDMINFGSLMNASHYSMSVLYEVSCQEVDLLVLEMQKMHGVLGSRMTGGGFGGCTITLIKEEDVEAAIDEVGKKYQEVTSIKADFYIAEIGDGAYKIK